MAKIAVKSIKIMPLQNFEDSCNVIDEEGKIVKLHRSFKKGKEEVWPELRLKKLLNLKLVEVVA